MEWFLHGIEHLRLCDRQIAAKITQEGGLRKAAFITVKNDAGRSRRRWELPCQSRVVLSSIRCAGSDINQRRNLRMHTSFRKDHPRKRVTNKYSGTVLPI